MPDSLHKTDVFISGGGPAGLAAAIACRLQGLDVVVADCARPPVDKACGEGLLPHALAALDSLGVALNPDHAAPFRGINFVDAQNSVTARFPAGIAQGVRRTHLHQALRERASSLGVSFLWNTQVLGLKEDHDATLIQTAASPIQTRWTIGADGLHSRIRLWSGLDRGTPATRRIGLRTHLRIAPWSEFVEVHWTDTAQAYVTPIAADEIGFAVISRRRHDVRSIDQALQLFPALAARLANALRSSHERGSATFTRTLPRVTEHRTALIGDASGSVDAVTGEGLGLAFHQALALASAIRANDLAAYQRAHRGICRRAALMSHALLLLDRSPALRRLTLRSFARRPELFEHLLAIHTGDAPLTLLGRAGALTLGLQLLRG